MEREKNWKKTLLVFKMFISSGKSRQENHWWGWNVVHARLGLHTGAGALHENSEQGASFQRRPSLTLSSDAAGVDLSRQSRYVRVGQHGLLGELTLGSRGRWLQEVVAAGIVTPNDICLCPIPSSFAITSSLAHCPVPALILNEICLRPWISALGPVSLGISSALFPPPVVAAWAPPQQPPWSPWPPCTQFLVPWGVSLQFNGCTTASRPPGWEQELTYGW